MIIGVAGVLFDSTFDGPGRVLLGLRKKVDGFGLWVLPGGGLNEGEHPDDGVKRECKEEVGVDVECGVRVYFEYLPECKDGCLMLYYTDTVDPSTVSLCAEHEFSELRWFDSRNLPEKMWSSDRAAVRAALSYWRAP